MPEIQIFPIEDAPLPLLVIAARQEGYFKVPRPIQALDGELHTSLIKFLMAKGFTLLQRSGGFTVGDPTELKVTTFR